MKVFHLGHHNMVRQKIWEISLDPNQVGKKTNGPAVSRLSARSIFISMEFLNFFIVTYPVGMSVGSIFLIFKNKSIGVA